MLLDYSATNYVLGNLFAQPLSMSSLVYLLVWSPPPHITYISSPNQCLLFAAHDHTTATCFAVVSINIVSSIPSLFQLLTWNSVFYLNITHPSDHFHLCSLKCHLIFTAPPQCSHCNCCTSYGNSIRMSGCLPHAGIVSNRRQVAWCSLH